jgi:hypothetical protein
MDRRARARDLVQAALAAVEEELASPTSKLCSAELGTCRDTLRGYLAELEQGALRPRGERGEGLGRLVADAWGYDVPLGSLVVQAERAWRNA